MSNHINRRRFLGGIGAAGLAGLAGCVGGTEEDPADDAVITHELIGWEDAEHTLEWWTGDAWTPDPDQAQDAQRAEGYRDTVQAWIEAVDEPIYRIEPRYHTDLDQWRRQILQAADRGADALPEMGTLNHPWVPNVWDDLGDVSHVVGEIEDDFFPFVENMCKRPNGDWVGIWQYTDTRALYYRRDLIDEYADGEPPQTWDEIIEVGQAIADGEDMGGYLYNGGTWPGTTFDNLGMFWGQGGKVVDYETGEYVFEEYRDEVLNVFEWFERTVETGVTPQRVVNIDDYELLSRAGLNEEVAMFLGGNWQIESEIRPAYDSPEAAEEEWGVTGVPQMETDMDGNSAGGWCEVSFSDDDDLQPAVDAWIEVFSDAENMAHYNRLSGNLPTRRSIYEDVEFFREDDYIQTFAEGLEYARPAPGFGVWDPLTGEWSTEAGKVLSGQATPEEAVDTMLSNLDDQIDLPRP